MDSSMEEEDNLLEFSNVPLNALDFSTVQQLSLMLDVDMPIPTREGHLKDWQGLAGLAGFKLAEIRRFRNECKPTQEVLARWPERHKNVTIRNLIEYLIKLTRFDVIDDLMGNFKRDAEHYKRQPEVIHRTKMLHNGLFNPKIITGADARNSDQSNLQQYDAYLCYTDADQDFALQILNSLENEYGLKLYIKDRDMIAGTFELTADIQMIQERCHKFIVILSPEFYQSPMAEFLTMIAHTFSLEEQKRKVIPIVYKQCTIPPMIRSMAKLDYTNNTFNNFWDRLLESLLRLPLDPLNSISLPLSRLSSSQSFDNKQARTPSPLLNAGPSTSGYGSSRSPYSRSTSDIPSSVKMESEMEIEVLQKGLSTISVQSDSNVSPILSKKSKKTSIKNWLKSQFKVEGKPVSTN